MLQYGPKSRDWKSPLALAFQTGNAPPSTLDRA